MPMDVGANDPQTNERLVAPELAPELLGMVERATAPRSERVEAMRFVEQHALRPLEDERLLRRLAQGRIRDDPDCGHEAVDGVDPRLDDRAVVERVELAERGLAGEASRRVTRGGDRRADSLLDALQAR